MHETLRQEVRFLTTRLGAIVREQCGAATFEAIERLRKLAKQIRQNPDPKLLELKESAVRELASGRATEVAHAFSLLRNPYVDPLNFLQTRFLAKWRAAPDQQPDILHLLQITVGGIAFGMKSTG